MTLSQSSPTRLIPLTQGLWTLVDAADYPLLSMHKWCAHASGHGFYAQRGFVLGPWRDGKIQHERMHRRLLDAPNGMLVDHINGDSLDNRRCNLRLATQTQNIRNRGVQSNNTSGYKGVIFRPDMNRWTAQLKKTHLGYFETPEDAAHAYDAVAIKVYGEFARLNF